MNDYGGMVRQLMMHATPVGDVLPFIKKGLGPNPMNLSEGAGRVQAGGSVTQMPSKGFDINNFRDVSRVSPEAGRMMDRTNQIRSDLMNNKGLTYDQAMYEIAKMKQDGTFWPK
jgi:hypothetical protein